VNTGRLEYRVLGPLEALRDDETLGLGGAKQRALLAILLMQANRVVATDELIERLWPDRAPGKPETAIQGYVSELRKALEPLHRAGAAFEVLVTEPNGYRIRVEPNALDSERFAHLLSEGREALTRKHPQDAAAMLAKALTLWRGSPLADFTDAPWAQSERARLEELRLTCVEERVDADLALGRHSELIGEIEMLVAEQPLRERLRAQFMRALYLAGRQTEALAVYRRTRTTLLEELGIDPSPELQALEVAILNQDPALTPATRSAATPTNLPAPPTALLGRGTEVGALERLLARPDVRLVTVTGPGGIGKTRIAMEAAKQMQARFSDGVWWVPLQSGCGSESRAVHSGADRRRS
jgi:DNA-binding SARP family transcriptional activator